ncbi:MAG: pentapeptide repeat-containing protein [Planctomycetes bacterium]|nr:pentapeptide repeat-containing protein [Planctomycetota bacterium]
MSDTTTGQMLERALSGATSLAAWNEYVLESEREIDLTGVDLCGSNLSGLVLARCKMDGAQMANCRIVNVNFAGASLVEAVFEGSNLAESSFQRANARRSRFRRCQVEGTDFSWCNLTEADLSGVDLSVAKLWKTDLRGANYSFTARADQFFVREPDRKVEEAAASVPLERMLQVVGGMLGIPYRWEGAGKMPSVEMPERLDDPREFLESTLAKFGLVARARAGADGALVYVVSPIDRHGDLPHLRKRHR